jgi:4-cresol dehydrogenase (hydroxylating)
MDLVSERDSFNHHADRRFCETIKDAVDPPGIRSPGQQGIWPATMRSDRPSEA